MSTIADELQKLHRLLEIGAITTEEYEQAKSKLLKQQDPAEQSSTEERLVQLELQNALLKAEQDWQAEREQYLSFSKGGGGPYEPTGATVAWSILYCGFVFILCGWLASSPRLSWGERLLLLFTAAMAFALPLYGWIRYKEFKAACSAYLFRRTKIRERYENRIKSLRG